MNVDKFGFQTKVVKAIFTFFEKSSSGSVSFRSPRPILARVAEDLLLRVVRLKMRLVQMQMNGAGSNSKKFSGSFTDETEAFY